ncbi:MAG: AAA family ATPase [Clostridia bacterium]|nr:AAA family ATPase [Clostridia bacterium]
MNLEELNEKEYIRYSEVEEREINWLWFPYIAKDMVTVLQGDPKCGKSFLLSNIISKITTGDYIPFSEEKFEIGTVIFQNNEDPKSQVILPRLLKQGADVDKVIFINEEKESLCVQNFQKIEKIVSEVKPVLLVLDPIQSYIGDINMNAMNEVRKALNPLKEIAEKYNCAIVLVQHLKKGVEAKSIYKGAGSIDFIGFARSILLVTKNPDNKDERLFLPVGGNLGKDGDCLSYKIDDNGVTWLENKGNLDVDLLTNETSDTKVEQAKNFILGCLASGKEVRATDLEEMKEVGKFASRTFASARSQLEKQDLIIKQQCDKKWWWKLNSIDSKVQSCKVNAGKEGGDINEKQN